MLRFAAVFVVLVVLVSAFELYLLRNQIGVPLRAGIARAVGWCLRFTSVPVGVEGTTIHVAAAELDVVIECTGIKATGIFWAGVLAFPCSWRARFAGLLTGLVGVGLLNFLRILLLAVAAGYRYGWFESLHALLMQGFVVVFVAPLWIVWMLQASKGHAPSTPDAPARVAAAR